MLNESDISDLKKDIEYFEQLNFVNLAEKFKRDLRVIEYLLQTQTKKEEA